MYERLKRLYLQNKLNDEHLHNAVDRNWITEEQYQEIISLKAVDNE